MSVVKRIQIYPSQQVPALEPRPEGVPFRWLESLVSKLRAAIDDAEEGTCLITGVEGLRAYYDHTLSPLESAQDIAQALEKRLAQISSMLPHEGEGLMMSADEVNNLRKLLQAPIR